MDILIKTMLNIHNPNEFGFSSLYSRIFLIVLCCTLVVSIVVLITVIVLLF
jgi:hypothetical protein